MSHPLHLLICLTIVIFSALAGIAEAVERPLIWATPQEKRALFDKITNYEWAKMRFVQLRHRANQAVPRNPSDRARAVRKLPLRWGKKGDHFPAFIEQKNVGNNHLRHPLQLGLQDGVDCGILYYLTEDEKYARCAADILYTVVQGLTHTRVNLGKSKNNGWIIPDNHLLESRIYGAQIPLIYDFVYNYLKGGGKVYDAHLDKLVAFDFDAAQQIFETYVMLALNSGLVNNNWPVLETSSLLNNILAIDDDEKRAELLDYSLYKDTDHQDSLATVGKNFLNEGDIWPESLNYSIHVAYFSLYVMTVVDRLYPDINLGSQFPNIGTALLTYEQLRFPNGDYPAFGDGDRTYRPNYFEYELAYTSALLNNNQASAQAFAKMLNRAIESGEYDRSKLAGQTIRATPYYSPLELLWSVPDIKVNEPVAGEEDNTKDLFKIQSTYRLPFAGMFFQRNIFTSDPVNNGLMATTGGGSYVHGHASGSDLELYGQGHVLGIEAGKAGYTDEVHIQYHRLFAGHNTVISNGASASQGGWINLGINTVEKVAMEPLPAKEPVSKNFTFATVSFVDEFNLVAKARHERTTVIIRLSDDAGYYLDVFRAKSDTPNQFHDYLYRNIADSLAVATNGEEVSFSNDSRRYAAAGKLPKVYNKKYQHPGWHFFDKVESAPATRQSIEAEFKADNLKNSPVYMKASVVEGLNVTFTKALAPVAKIAEQPYDKKKLPVMVLRHEGEAWENPFAVVYESYQGNNKPAVQSTQRIIIDGQFKGVHVVAEVEGKKVEQYILMQQGSEDALDHKNANIKFVGRFGIVTVIDGELDSLYIGDGSELSYKDNNLIASNSTAGFIDY